MSQMQFQLVMPESLGPRSFIWPARQRGICPGHLGHPGGSPEGTPGASGASSSVLHQQRAGLPTGTPTPRHPHSTYNKGNVMKTFFSLIYFHCFITSFWKNTIDRLILRSLFFTFKRETGFNFSFPIGSTCWEVSTVLRKALGSL